MAQAQRGADMKVLLIAPNVDGPDVGEAHVAFKWAEALAARVDLTLLSFERPGRRALAEQLPGARVVTWPEPGFVRRHERLNAMLKPVWPLFSRKVRVWLKSALGKGESFDITHQLMPQAARYASPLRHFQIPFVIGPLAGRWILRMPFGPKQALRRCSQGCGLWMRFVFGGTRDCGPAKARAPAFWAWPPMWKACWAPSR